MAGITQKNRGIKLKTPLGDDDLLICTMSEHEGLGKLFDCSSTNWNYDADFNQLLVDTLAATDPG